MSRLIAAVLLIVVFARPAAAGPLQLDVVGDACALDSLEADVIELLPSLSLPTASLTRVRIETVQEPERVVANIWFPDRVDGQRGPRVVSAKTCAQLMESIALVIAMALPEAGTHQGEPSGATNDEPPAPNPLIVDEVPPRTPVATKNAVAATVSVVSARRTLVGLYAAGGSGVTANGLRGQLLVGARVQRGSRSLGLQVRADAPEEREVTTTGGIRVQRAELSISPCIHLGSVAGCGVASMGTIRGQGIGLHAPRSAFTPLVSTGVRVTWEHELIGPVAVRAYIEAQALLTSAEFEVDFMPVWTSERFEGSGGFGLLAHFL